MIRENNEKEFLAQEQCLCGQDHIQWRPLGKSFLEYAWCSLATTVLLSFSKYVSQQNPSQ